MSKGFEQFSDNLQFAQNECVDYFKRSLGNDIEILPVNKKGREYKSDRNIDLTEVKSFYIDFKFNLDTTDISTLLTSLEKVGTSDKLSQIIQRKVEIARNLRNLLNINGLEGQPRSIDELMETGIPISSEDIFFLLDSDEIPEDFFENLLNGDVRLEVEFVYKRLGKSKEVFLKEVEHYRVFNEEGINTLYALRFIAENNSGDYEYTLFEKNMVLLYEESGLLNRNNGILKTAFLEIARMHKKKLFHNDLHTSNIGSIKQQGRPPIILFDLSMGSVELRGSDTEDFLKTIFKDLEKFLRSIAQKAILLEMQERPITEDDKAYIIECLEAYKESMAKDREFGPHADKIWKDNFENYVKLIQNNFHIDQ